MVRSALHLASCVLLSLAFCAPGVLGEPNPPGEYQVKAAFLYNFTKFVVWPADSSAHATPLKIGVLGRSPITQALVRRVAPGLNVVVVELKRAEEIESSNCNVLFISMSERQRVHEILAKVGNRPVLTVSDIRRFVEAGGMIGLVMVGDTIKFEINHRAALRSRLQLSSHLLRLATAVLE